MSQFVIVHPDTPDHGGKTSNIVEGARSVRWPVEAGQRGAHLPPRFVPSGTQLADVLPGTEALVFSPWIRGCVTDARFWQLATSLRVISGTFDNRFEGWLDIAEAERRGVSVIDTSRCMTPVVAEFAVALTLNLVRNIPTGLAELRAGRWPSASVAERSAAGSVLPGGLRGRRIGLAGFGVICRSYVELVAPFRCQFSAYDPFVADDILQAAGVTRAASLVELASNSDIFVVGIPPTPATLGIVDATVINALPVGASIVIPTRMAVVDQDALWRRAEAGEIGVATDVFDPEPPPADAPFLNWPNVLATPHMAGQGHVGTMRCHDVAVEEALAVLRNEPTRFGVTTDDARIYRGVETTDTLGRAGR